MRPAATTDQSGQHRPKPLNCPLKKGGTASFFNGLLNVPQDGPKSTYCALSPRNVKLGGGSGW